MTRDRQVVGLGGPRGEHQVRRVSADQRGNLQTGAVDQRCGPPARRMAGGRITQAFGQYFAQRCDDLRIDRRGGGVIEIGHRGHGVCPPATRRRF